MQEFALAQVAERARPQSGYQLTVDAIRQPKKYSRESWLTWALEKKHLQQCTSTSQKSAAGLTVWETL